MKKVVSLADISKELGISKMSVSLALRGKNGVSEQLRGKVLAYAKKIGYKRDAEICRTMASIKLRGAGQFCGTIAMLLAVENESVLVNHPTFSEFHKGILRGAEKIGYNIDTFCLYEKGTTAKSLMRIFKSRGIRGGVLAGMYDSAYLSPKFSELWKEFKFIAVGLRTYNPHLDYTSADQYLVARNAVKELLNLGYTRPALVLDKNIHDVVEGRFAGGFLEAQLRIKSSDRIPPFFHNADVVESEKNFAKWYLKHKPDSILCLYNTPKKWLENLGVKIPKDVALVQLERRAKNPEWSGMNQHNDVVGELAVRRLSDFLNAPFVSSSPITASFVSPDWHNAKTAKRKLNRKTNKL